jgi:hypothetical protein
MFVNTLITYRVRIVCEWCRKREMTNENRVYTFPAESILYSDKKKNNNNNNESDGKMIELRVLFTWKVLAAKTRQRIFHFRPENIARNNSRLSVSICVYKYIYIYIYIFHIGIHTRTNHAN